jgi:hypothetical protein
MPTQKSASIAHPPHRKTDTDISSAERKLTSHLLSKMQSGAHSPLPTPTPPAIATPAATPYSRSRLSQQVHPRSNRRAAAMVQEDEEMDPDAEGEEDEEMDGDGEEAEDKGLYCFCQQMSHGEVSILPAPPPRATNESGRRFVC